MYDAISGIEVYLEPYRKDDEDPEKQYPEYEAPRGSPVYTGNHRERYIEAVTDERYQIVTILHPKFNFSGKGAVRIHQNIDNSLRPCGYLRAKERLPGTSMTDITTTVLTTVDGTKQLVSLSFGSGTPRSQLDSTSREDASEFAKQGRIIIEVQRGRAELRTKTKLNGKNVTFVPEHTSKNVAIDNGKFEGSKLIPPGEDHEPTARTMFTPPKGKAGQVIRFIFYYTSRMHLERKKILLRTLTPSLPPSAISDRAINQYGSNHSSFQHNSETLIGMNDRDDEESFLTAKAKTEPARDTGIDHTGHVERPKATEIIEILDVDNEIAPLQKIETVPFENRDSFLPPHMPTGTVAQASAASGKITTTSNQTGNPVASSTLADFARQSKKSKEKSRLMLELEEIRIKKRLQELEDDEND